ncbi:probable UDP-sugar transporter protein SLC35A5 [Nematostella vectensis]|uniref:probable UDP-sugar transporter protein SLC35A5 n=1 Tax=Nematostella vectensis TaxID=45351 RepID=UPI002077541A|nr:probable UDP-sugar transporter protein SLC35A5 [Nematostella vectensis]
MAALPACSGNIAFTLYRAHHVIFNPASLFHTIALAGLFICLGCSRTFLIKFSMRDGGYDYLPVTVNVMAEFIKFVFCLSISFYILLYKEGKRRKDIISFAGIQWLQLFKWSVPGLLYFFDNLLGFYILVNLSPAVYSLMGNFVIITTAILFRIVLKRKLSRTQWASLVILFLSIVALSNQNPDTGQLKHHQHVVQDKPSEDVDMPEICRRVLVAENYTSVAEVETSSFQMNKGHVLVLIQCLMSSSANIYNEKIFKEGSGMDDSIYLQNSKLYAFGILFNTVPLVLRSDFRNHVWRCGFFHGHNTQSFLLIIVTAAYGLTVALILKFRDNMFQVMSFQLTNVLIITSSVLFMDFHPALEFFLIAPIVLLAIFVFNAGKKKNKKVIGEVEYTSLERGDTLME